MPGRAFSNQFSLEAEEEHSKAKPREFRYSRGFALYSVYNAQGIVLYQTNNGNNHQ